MIKKERKKKWSPNQLSKAVKSSTSVRQVLKKLNLVQAGGNYNQIQKHISLQKLDISHFKGMAWNKGLTGIGKPRIQLDDILVENSPYQSFKLKKRLFDQGLKNKKCELCGWSKRSKDGRLPLELDHVNGVRTDNRLANLRVLCPNCHSLQPTHRGRNKKGSVVEWYTRNT